MRTRKMWISLIPGSGRVWSRRDLRDERVYGDGEVAWGAAVGEMRTMTSCEGRYVGNFLNSRCRVIPLKAGFFDVHDDCTVWNPFCQSHEAVMHHSVVLSTLRFSSSPASQDSLSSAKQHPKIHHALHAKKHKTPETAMHNKTKRSQMMIHPTHKHISKNQNQTFPVCRLNFPRILLNAPSSSSTTLSTPSLTTLLRSARLLSTNP